MKHIEHNGYLLVEVPSIAFGFDVNNYGDESELMYVLDIEEIDESIKHDETLITKKLPPGQWEIIGKGNEIKEQVCKGIVQYDIHPMEDYVIGYTDYDLDDDNVLLDTAKKSLDSLIKSHGMKPSECLILKLKTNE